MIATPAVACDTKTLPSRVPRPRQNCRIRSVRSTVRRREVSTSSSSLSVLATLRAAIGLQRHGARRMPRTGTRRRHRGPRPASTRGRPRKPTLSTNREGRESPETIQAEGSSALRAGGDPGPRTRAGRDGTHECVVLRRGPDAASAPPRGTAERRLHALLGTGPSRPLRDGASRVSGSLTPPPRWTRWKIAAARPAARRPPPTGVYVVAWDGDARSGTPTSP